MSQCVAFLREARGGPSIAAQRAIIGRYVRDRGETVDVWYEGHAGYLDLLDALDAGAVRLVVVAKLDLVVATIERLQRLLDSLAEDNVAFASVLEGLSIPGPHGDLVWGILAACSRLQWLQLSDVLSEGLRYRHRVATRGPETKHYGLRPGEQLVAEHIRQLSMDQLSQEAIARFLMRDGVPARRGGKWCRKIVGRILKRPPRPYDFPEEALE